MQKFKKDPGGKGKKGEKMSDNIVLHSGVNPRCKVIKLERGKVEEASY